MLVRLLDLPAPSPAPEGFLLRRPLAAESGIVTDWIRAHFHRGWADEITPALHAMPARLILAQQSNQIFGFAAWNVTAPGFFGPLGVARSARGHGLGRALLHAALDGLRSEGYVYAVIGDASNPDFYARNCDALSLPDRGSSIYDNMLIDD